MVYTRLIWDVDKVKNMNRNVNSAIQVALSKIWLMVANTSKELAPYQTWNLRRSISVDFTRVQKWTVVVWSPEPYARRREFENYKNPDRKYLMIIWNNGNIFIQNDRRYIIWEDVGNKKYSC